MKLRITRLVMGSTTALGLALLGACSTSNTVAPVAQSDFPSQYANALCQSIQGCCSQAHYAYDEAACEAAAKQNIENGLKTIPSTATYNATEAGACIAAARSAFAACSNDFPRDYQSACTSIFSGKAQLGEACTSQYDCAPSTTGLVGCQTFAGNGGQAKRICIASRPPQTGDACLGFGATPPAANTVGECLTDASFYCESKSLTCQPRIAVGQSCTDRGSCVSGAICNNGTCVATPQIGDSCIGLFTCATGAYCDIATGKCVAQLKPGSACKANIGNECQGGECLKGTCSAGIEATPSTCAGDPSAVNNSDAGN